MPLSSRRLHKRIRIFSCFLESCHTQLIQRFAAWAPGCRQASVTQPAIHGKCSFRTGTNRVGHHSSSFMREAKLPTLDCLRAATTPLRNTKSLAYNNAEWLVFPPATCCPDLSIEYPCPPENTLRPPQRGLRHVESVWLGKIFRDMPPLRSCPD